jgi:hypothetical protein
MMHRHHFAPGVIDGPYRTERRWPRLHAIQAEAIRCLLDAICLSVLCAVIGFAAGYLGWMS